MPPAAGVAQPLRFEQIRFAPPQLLFRLLACIDVRQQVVPADDAPFGIAKRETARLEPLDSLALRFISDLPARPGPPGRASVARRDRLDPLGGRARVGNTPITYP